MRSRVIATLLALLAVAAGCGEPTDTCTTEDVVITLAVRDATGAPATGVALTVTVARTGVAVDLSRYAEHQALLPPGEYVVFGDQVRRVLLGRTQDLLVRGSRGGATFATTARVAPGGCHVQKLGGPDVVTLSP